MEEKQPKFSKYELIFNKIKDAESLDYDDLREFVEFNKLDFIVDDGVSVEDNLADLRKVARRPSGEKKKAKKKAVEPQEKPSEPVIMDEPKPEVPKKHDPYGGKAYLLRRREQIEAAQAKLQVGGTDASPAYGENAPGFLKRRFGGGDK